MSARVKRDDDRLQKVIQTLSKNPKGRLRVGVSEPNIVEYATYLEYGWAQRVTVRQALYLSKALGKPVGNGKNGKPNVRAAAVKPGTTLVMQPRPFMRSTVAEKQKEWIKKIGVIFSNCHDSARTLGLVGKDAVNDIRATIQAGGTSRKKFDKRKPMTLELYKQAAKEKGHRIKKGDVSNTNTDKPLMNTGALFDAISFWVEE